MILVVILSIVLLLLSFCYVFVSINTGYVSSDVFKEIYVWEHDVSPEASIARLHELADFVEISKCIHEDVENDDDI